MSHYANPGVAKKVSFLSASSKFSVPLDVSTARKGNSLLQRDPKSVKHAHKTPSLMLELPGACHALQESFKVIWSVWLVCQASTITTRNRRLHVRLALLGDF